MAHWHSHQLFAQFLPTKNLRLMSILVSCSDVFVGKLNGKVIKALVFRFKSMLFRKFTYNLLMQSKLFATNGVFDDEVHVNASSWSLKIQEKNC